MRAFARDLKISNSAVSLLMRGQVGLSKKRATQISKHLGFSQEESQYFTELVRAKRAKLEKTRKEASLNLRQYDTRFSSIEAASFHLISKWYALPVMELIRMYGLQADKTLISRRLKITEQEVSHAMEALRTLKILRATKSGNVITADFISLPDGSSPDALIRQFHQTILDRAKVAVAESPKSERNISCTIMRMRKKDMSWVAKEMRIFRRKLAARIEDGDAHDSIYALSMQLFRLDQDI